jgi:hypothetical protein
MLLFGSTNLKHGRHFDYWNQPLNMCMHICYLDCHEAGLCCYLVIHIENLLRPLQLFYFHFWPIYWLSLIVDWSTRNREKTKYMLMSCHQNAEQNHNINTSNRSSENVAKLKYFRMTLSQNFIHEEIQVDDKFFRQKRGMATRSSLSLINSNIFKEHFKKLVLYSVQHKLSLWLQYIDATFVV